MAGPPNGSFAQVTLSFQSSFLPYGAVVTWGTDYAEAPDRPTAVAISALVVEPLVEALTSSTTSTVDLSWKFGPTATGPTYTVPISVVGTVGGEQGTANTAYLIRKVHGETSGRFDGRLYWPGVSVDVISGAGNIATENLEDFQDALNVFQAAWEEDIGSLYIFPASASDPKRVNSLQIQAVCGTQRRRLRR